MPGAITVSRRTSQPFRCQPLAELTRQLLFAPPDRRAQQVHRAEQLHDKLDSAAEYPLEFLSYRITGYRSESLPPSVLDGEAVLHDLRLLIDRLSHSAPLPPTEEDPVESPQDLAARLSVSVKTLSRWRGLGLRWRWVIPPGQRRKTIAYPTAAVEHFLAGHRHRAQRAAAHTHLTSKARQQLLQRAARIAQRSDASLNRVATHLAAKIRRAPQTVRLILEQHDRDHPDAKLFPCHDTPLDPRRRRQIARAHREGVPIDQIISTFNRNRTTIYRALRHRRAAALRRLRIAYVDSPRFHQDDADVLILHDDQTSPAGSTRRRAPDDQRPNQRRASVDDLPKPLRDLFDRPTPDAAVQRACLLRYNYFKFKAAHLIAHLNRYDPRAADLDQAAAMVREAGACRRCVAVDSLPVVLSVVRRHLIDQPNHATGQLFELLVLAVPELIGAIDRYDINRPQDFEPYLTWSLMRRFATVPGQDKAHRRLDAQETLRLICNTAASRGVRLVTAPPA